MSTARQSPVRRALEARPTPKPRPAKAAASEAATTHSSSMRCGSTPSQACSNTPTSSSSRTAVEGRRVELVGVQRAGPRRGAPVDGAQRVAGQVGPRAAQRRRVGGRASAAPARSTSGRPGEQLQTGDVEHPRQHDDLLARRARSRTTPAMPNGSPASSSAGPEAVQAALQAVAPGSGGARVRTSAARWSARGSGGRAPPTCFSAKPCGSRPSGHSSRTRIQTSGSSLALLNDMVTSSRPPQAITAGRACARS